jgi:hypothetical protein
LSGGGRDRCGTAFKAWTKEGGDSVISTTTASPERERFQGAPYNDNRRAQGLRDRRLVVSSVDTHSADELCRDPMSLGPDLVSMAERTHCNMRTREVLPLCAEGVNTGCFDLEAAAGTTRTASSGDGIGNTTSANLTHAIYW